MQITEVRIKLSTSGGNERLRAFGSVTFDDCFVIRDLKIIDGARGLFVAMPSRKLNDRCAHCGCKNHLRAAHCNSCGHAMDPNRALVPNEDERTRLHADIAHPINSSCRQMLEGSILKAYTEEVELSKQPGYVSRHNDLGED